ncbi:MAG TPA: LemA family protein [Thermoleophilaceae bacterium]|nr:LemA family protein [Thermoleophilaceae bacterium]
MALLIVVAIVVLLVAFVVVTYNALVAKRNRSQNAWAQVDVQLRRRYDLIPNLVESVKGYASHEQSTFQAVTEARAAAQSAEGPAEQAQAEAALSGALGRLMAVAEAYPALRATENFQQLQAELGETEDKIATARQIYNDTVLTYNNAVQQIPTNIVAGIFRFKTREYFEVAAGDPAREPVAVEF